MQRNKLYVLLASIVTVALSLNLCSLPILAEAETSISAKAAALYEPETKTFIYEKSGDERLPMASTTKIMTALVAIERENLDKQIAVDERAVGIEGSSAYLRANEIFTLKELLYALMLQSANDAAAAIAYAIAGSVDAFADLMNQKAISLGLSNTNFTNPHGLDDCDHYTTAKDLAVISACALTYPEFSEIVSSKTKKVEKNGITRLFVNHNKLLTRYKGCVGIKTGFTKKSGRSLVSAAERDGVTLICVTIDAPNDWKDHEKLLDLGFSSTEKKTILSADSFEYSLPVLNAENDSIRIGINQNISVISVKGNEEIKYEIQLPRFAVAPIKAGSKIGEIVVLKSGKIISSHDLIALENVNARKKMGLFSLFE